MKRLIPYPLLSTSLVVMWLLLTDFTVGQLIIAIGVAIFAGLAMSRLEPQKVIIRNWRVIPLLFVRIVIDITKSNFSVASIILVNRKKTRRSGMIAVPLQLEHPTGLAILACILTAAPGSAWISYSSNSHTLLLHILDLEEEDYWRNLIANRYETLLMEMFR